MPNSGWPITYSELLPYVERATVVCEAGRCSFDAEDTFTADRAPMIEGFDGSDVTTTRLERWSPPTNFAKRYSRELGQSPNVRVYLGAHALRVQLSPDGRSVDYVLAATRPGREFSVRAKAFVVAAGGLENPRLLLCSKDVHPAGIGNSNGLVGRYYMSHLIGVAETVRIADTGASFRYGFETDGGGVHCRRRFALTELTQADRSIGNAVATLVRPFISDATHRDPLFSAAFLGKQYLDILRRSNLGRLSGELRRDRGIRREHWRVMAHASPRSALDTLSVVRQRYLARRRLPMILGDPAVSDHHLCYQAEHAPNAHSRVTLADERDAFGIPRLAVRVAFSEIDWRTVVELHRVISARFAATRTGSLRFDESRIRGHISQAMSQFNSQAHHLGTTRMSRSPRTGVVDGDCKLH
jgi:choline dehydrogenase-like flavoprotein